MHNRTSMSSSVVQVCLNIKLIKL